MKEPLYQKIIRYFKEKIESGELTKDEKLPSESEIMELFQTSRITVTRALKELELTGSIYRVKGKGSFVSVPRKSNHRIISLILPHREETYFAGQQYIRSIYRSCQEKGYLCSVHYSEQSSQRERTILEEVMSHQVSGMILYPINNRNIDYISRMSISGFPIVLLDRNLRELNLPVVKSDNFQGAWDAVTYLASCGHKKIGFVGFMDSEAVSLRYQGYCRALTENRIPLDPSIIISRPEDQTDEIQAELDQNQADRILLEMQQKGVTALFCVNDLIASRMILAAVKRGITVPGDLSVCGFDNLKYLQDPDTCLTTVEQDFNRIGETCVNLLTSLIETGRTDQAAGIIPTRLLEGNTVRKIPES